MIKDVTQFVKDVQLELSKVTWPKFDEFVGSTIVALLLMSYFSNEVWQWNWSGFALTSMLIQTSAGAFASYLAWMWLLGRYPATKIGTFAFLTPVFALIFGALWLGEAVTLSLLGALAMVGVGIALVNKRKPA